MTASPDRGFPVLLVDDDPAHRMLLKRALSALEPPPAVREADGIAAARRLLFGGAAIPLTLIIVDLNLRDGHGTALVSELRQSSSYGAAQVLIISTSSLDADVTKSYRAGAHGFVVKSDDPKRFAEEVCAAARCLVALAAS